MRGRFLLNFRWSNNSPLISLTTCSRTPAPLPTATLAANGMDVLHPRRSTKDAPTQKRLGMVTTIKPEKEAEYRSLHQAVWPGVVDGFVETNHRQFSIFFMELGDELLEMFYIEYIGTDSKADGAKNQANPFNHRWWETHRRLPATPPWQYRHLDQDAAAHRNRF